MEGVGGEHGSLNVSFFITAGSACFGTYIQNQRTIGSGYLKPNQNQRTASSVCFKNPSENPSLGFMKELAFFLILEADVKLKPRHKTI